MLAESLKAEIFYKNGTATGVLGLGVTRLKFVTREGRLLPKVDLLSKCVTPKDIGLLNIHYPIPQYLYLLRKPCVINDKLKLTAQKLDSLAHHCHTAEENFKILNDLGKFIVNL